MWISLEYCTYKCIIILFSQLINKLLLLISHDSSNTRPLKHDSLTFSGSTASMTRPIFSGSESKFLYCGGSKHALSPGSQRLGLCRCACFSCTSKPKLEVPLPHEACMKGYILSRHASLIDILTTPSDFRWTGLYSQDSYIPSYRP